MSQMNSRRPQLAALRHFLSSIRGFIQSLQAALATALPLAKADYELLISFYWDLERTAKNQIELHELTHGGIEALKEACAHPERYITNAPRPPIEIFDRTPQRPRLTREEQIERKREQKELELQRAEARSSELEKAIHDWYLHTLPEWNKAIADAQTRLFNNQPPAIEQVGASKAHSQEMHDVSPIDKEEAHHGGGNSVSDNPVKKKSHSSTRIVKNYVRRPLVSGHSFPVSPIWKYPRNLKDKLLLED